MKGKNEKGKRAVKNLLVLVIIPLLVWRLIGGIVGAITLFLILLYKFIRIKQRGYFIKDLKGEEVKTKQFFKRWRKGIDGITPLQQARTTLLGMWIVVSGLVGGITVTSIVRIENVWWWMLIILSGSFIVTVISLIGAIQKYWRFKEVDKIQKEINKEVKNET